jgi:chromosome segregation ATPase
MASDDAGDAPVSTTVEEPLRAWLDEEAERLGVSRAEFVRRLLATYRTVSKDAEAGTLALDGAASFDGPDPEELDARLDELDAALDGVETDVQRKIDDVRERVVQVKRETDAKAPGDHDHADLREQVEGAASTVAQVRAEVGSLQEAVTEVREDLDAGFENYEDVLEYLTDATDDVEEKVTVLAGAMVDVRNRTATVAVRESARRAADDLARQANALGVRTAKCEECDLRVDLGLLARPECPHCASSFTEVEQGGWFRPATLVVGNVPALEGAEVDLDDELEAMLDEEDGP